MLIADIAQVARETVHLQHAQCVASVPGRPLCSSLCNDSTLAYDAATNTYQRIGESTELALRVFAEKVSQCWQTNPAGVSHPHQAYPTGDAVVLHVEQSHGSWKIDKHQLLGQYFAVSCLVVSSGLSDITVGKQCGCAPRLPGAHLVASV
jgi:hypothetical protein